MPQSREVHNAYQRGYSRGLATGRGNQWPDHKPPLPPNEPARQLVAALLALRNGVDAELATLSENDEFVIKLGPLVDDADAALAAVSKWLRGAGETALAAAAGPEGGERGK